MDRIADRSPEYVSATVTLFERLSEACRQEIAIAAKLKKLGVRGAIEALKVTVDDTIRDLKAGAFEKVETVRDQASRQAHDLLREVQVL